MGHATRGKGARKTSNEEIQGLVKKDESYPFPFPHKTFVKCYDDLKYESCTIKDCPCSTKQHCTLCSNKTAGRSKATNNSTTSFKQLKRHMTQYHWNKSVKHKGTLKRNFVTTLHIMDNMVWTYSGNKVDTGDFFYQSGK